MLLFTFSKNECFVESTEFATCAYYADGDLLCNLPTGNLPEFLRKALSETKKINQYQIIYYLYAMHQTIKCRCITLYSIISNPTFYLRKFSTHRLSNTLYKQVHLYPHKIVLKFHIDLILQ